MKITEHMGKMLLIFALMGSLVGSMYAMQRTKKSTSLQKSRQRSILHSGYGSQIRQVGLETVWVRTFDQHIVEVPQWQIDQKEMFESL